MIERDRNETNCLPTKLRTQAPWPIPAKAQSQVQDKGRYFQVKYCWQAGDWHYIARWHQQTPAARLICYPSWRLDRVRPGMGYGPHAQPRLEETWVGNRWLPTRRIRYYAQRLNADQATPEEVQLLRAAHPRGRQEGHSK